MSDEKRVASEPYDGAFGFCPPDYERGRSRSRATRLLYFHP